MKAKLVKESLEDRYKPSKYSVDNWFFKNLLERNDDIIEKVSKVGFYNQPDNIVQYEAFKHLDEDEVHMVSHMIWNYVNYTNTPDTLIVPVQGIIGDELMKEYEKTKSISKDIQTSVLDEAVSYSNDDGSPVSFDDIEDDDFKYKKEASIYQIPEDKWFLESLFDLGVCKLVFWEGKPLTFIAFSTILIK